MTEQPDIVPLEEKYIPALSRLLQQQSDNYLKSFSPFPFDEHSLVNQYRQACEDRYWLLLTSPAHPAGFFMLRGFDEGFTRPSFGVVVARQYAGRGWAQRALEFAIDWCASRKIEEIMLKVYPDNQAALSIYNKAGFELAGICDRTGQYIMVRRV